MSLSQPSSAPDTVAYANSTRFTNRILWGNVVLAALLMLATLPGRTQGLGLITEPLLADLKIDRIAYANINLWATLIGAAACLPMGWVLDRFGLRWSSGALVLMLAFVVWQMSGHTGGVMMLFLWVLLSRAVGQSALSVASITAAGKGTGKNMGLAMGVFSVLMIVFFCVAFPTVGSVVVNHGWRSAWQYIALGLALGIAPLVLLFLREPKDSASKAAATSGETLTGYTLPEALRSRAFWVFGGAASIFNLAISGLGLFNEAVLSEVGFTAEDYHQFLVVMTIFTLVGQGLCAWLTLRRPMPVLLGCAMFLYAVALGALPHIQTHTHLWILGGMLGITTGFITVIFFAVWGQAYGRAHLGRIQGAAQMLTVLASAVGPQLFERTHHSQGTYAPVLHTIAVPVVLLGIVAWRTKLPSPPSPAAVPAGANEGNLSKAT
jgi:MFS family permease